MNHKETRTKPSTLPASSQGHSPAAVALLDGSGTSLQTSYHLSPAKAQDVHSEHNYFTLTQLLYLQFVCLFLMGTFALKPLSGTFARRVPAPATTKAAETPTESSPWQGTCPKYNKQQLPPGRLTDCMYQSHITCS